MIKLRMFSNVIYFLICVTITVLLLGCGTPGGVKYSSGSVAKSIDPSVAGPVSGVGIEGQDIISMTDQMMRDMFTNPLLTSSVNPARVIVDSEYFVNDSSQAMNKNAITDRLRVNLNRVSQGRMVFVGRNYARMVEHERSLKRQSMTDTGTRGLTKAQAGADYRLAGRISSLDSRNSTTGMMQRYNQVIFEMVDLENGVVVWSGIYEFARTATDDIIYR